MGTIATDNFNTDGPLGTPPWSTWSGYVAPTVENNVVLPRASAETFVAVYTGAAFPVDQWSQISVQAVDDSASRAGCAVRGSFDRRGFYVLYTLGPLGPSAQLVLSRYSSSRDRSGIAETILASLATPVNASDVLKITVQGDQLQGWLNGVQILSATDSQWTDGEPGIFERGSLTTGLGSWSGGGV